MFHDKKASTFFIIVWKR